MTFGGYTYDLIDESHGYEMHRRSDGKFSVVFTRDGQVFSAMPGDMPQDGGQWVARDCDSGISYVAGGYSRSYARRKFHEFVAEASEFDEQS